VSAWERRRAAEVEAGSRVLGPQKRRGWAALWWEGGPGHGGAGNRWVGGPGHGQTSLSALGGNGPATLSVSLKF